jgi:RNA polymerase sigma factor, sigma-70 family
MDGASKFIKGDAIISIIITLVNIIGGLVVGVLINKMAITDAINVYTLATVGDGLVSQIPALLISTSTGIIVTRSDSGTSFGTELKQELLGNPNTIMSEEEVGAALQQSQMFNVVNFEALLYEKETESVQATEQHDPYHIVENREMNRALRQVIETLPEKEKMVIVLHYYEGLTMKNIARVLGVSESRVSQIHSKTLLKMKQALGPSQS